MTKSSIETTIDWYRSFKKGNNKIKITTYNNKPKNNNDDKS